MKKTKAETNQKRREKAVLERIMLKRIRESYIELTTDTYPTRTFGSLPAQTLQQLAALEHERRNL